MINNESPVFERRYPRRAMNNYVDVYYVHKRYLAKIVEISEGGMLIKVNYPFDPCAKMSLYFNINDHVFHARAEVRYVIANPEVKGQFYVGVMFLDRSYSKNEIIRKFVVEARNTQP